MRACRDVSVIFSFHVSFSFLQVSVQLQFSSSRIKMAQEFAGKWDFVDSDNFDGYMKAAGVGLVTRKVRFHPFYSLS